LTLAYSSNRWISFSSSSLGTERDTNPNFWSAQGNCNQLLSHLHSVALSLHGSPYDDWSILCLCFARDTRSDNSQHHCSSHALTHSGMVFEDSDELFDIEEYDSCFICLPRGSGTGFLGFPSLSLPSLYSCSVTGFRTLSESGARFHIYQRRRFSFSDLPKSGSLNSTPNSTSQSSHPRSLSHTLSTPSGGIYPPSNGGEVSSTSLLYLDHKYSEPMRQLNFQYVHEEEVSVSQSLSLSHTHLRNHSKLNRCSPVSTLQMTPREEGEVEEEVVVGEGNPLHRL
jgi:hypothetical protein